MAKGLGTKRTGTARRPRTPQWPQSGPKVATKETKESNERKKERNERKKSNMNKDTKNIKKEQKETGRFLPYQ